MKKFIVLQSRYHPNLSWQDEMSTQEAESFEDLVWEISGGYRNSGGRSFENIVTYMIENNGVDGADRYVIKELLPDGTLSKDLMGSDS